MDGVDVAEALLAPLGVGREGAKSSIVGVDRAGGEKEADKDGKFLGSDEHGGESLVRGERKEEGGWEIMIKMRVYMYLLRSRR